MNFNNFTFFLGVQGSRSAIYRRVVSTYTVRTSLPRLVVVVVVRGGARVSVMLRGARDAI